MQLSIGALQSILNCQLSLPSHPVLCLTLLITLQQPSIEVPLTEIDFLQGRSVQYIISDNIFN